MQQEIIDILERKKAFEKMWIHQTELVNELLKAHNANMPCICKALSRMREFDDVEFVTVTHENYKRMLKKIDRKELIEKPNLFRRYTFFYKVVK